ncbi:MAG TPA: hypothetical protein VLA97_17595 [Nocardioidaceae bacterium]|jgi:hypothetical protein|nr:hypothetical protein [Nocardioidaceae bacterium]
MARSWGRTSDQVRAKVPPSEERIASGIYGIIVGAAVMATSSAQTFGQLIASVLVTLLVYWVAERYARVLARRIADGRRPTWRELGQELTEGWAIVTESGLPLLVLVVLGLSGVEQRTAVLIALGTSTAVLCVAGWAVGRDNRLKPLERVASAVGAGAIGFAMIALKALLH